MITDIYYLFLIFVLYNQLKWILNPKQKIQKSVFLIDIIEKSKNNKDIKNTNDYKLALKEILYSCFIISILLLGIFTKQYLLFILLILIQLIIIKPISKLFKENEHLYISLHWFNSLIGFIFILFIICNQYYLNIDFIQLIKSLF